ncbi:hypothetical protein [Pseudocolwellia agarivorans]|uniref:hypothetical protein n=1 Tax=Pseudocolwellia agarivorans TaxID=1911682 RepID=UPI0009856B6B|nr:hypothetical protein [Pseudocolwellia agarivorans]
MNNKINAIILLWIIETFTLSSANAAFCSLRDPISAIQMIYEQGYQFRSVVTTVTEEDRQTVRQQLPFTIHQSEVGKHTLYVLYKDDKHVGFLQARSEWAKWGLVEIAWAMNVDRSIKGFYFQRCRSPECNDNTIQRINKVLKGKTLQQLKVLLSENGEMLSAEGKKAFSQTPQLALLTLRSALKTLAITDISWKKDIEQIAAVNH